KTPVSQVDLYPTLAQLCGVPTPEGLQGQSLVPILKDPSQAGRGWALTQVMRGGGARRASVTTNVSANGSRYFGYSLRVPRWRYTEWDEGRKGRELYDHDADPHELKNLADDPAYATTVADLSQRLREATKTTFPPS